MVARATAHVKREARRKRGRSVRRVIVASIVTLGAAVAAWYAVHHFDWAGPLVANGLRAVLGDAGVAKLEDWVYGAEDRVNRLLKKDDAPKSYWNVPRNREKVSPPSATAEVVEGAGEAPKTSAFQLESPGPALKEWSAPGDGVWVPVRDARHPELPACMLKTLLHPDKARSWAEVFVAAIDLTQTELFPVAGTQQPEPSSEEAKKYLRDGRIPTSVQDSLLAAFNGGFMTEHGGYGMKLDGVTLAAARERACTIASFADGSLRIASWQELAASQATMAWFRQAPECMWAHGILHAGLEAGAGLKKWGSTVDGETVIRRSGIGLNADRSVLFVAITNHTSARVLADGLHHAGASDVAQLDVNWSYPKFVTFEAIGRSNVLHPVPLAPGFEYSDDEYLRKREKRDFFYLVRKPREPRASGANGSRPP